MLGREAGAPAIRGEDWERRAGNSASEATSAQGMRNRDDDIAGEATISPCAGDASLRPRTRTTVVNRPGVANRSEKSVTQYVTLSACSLWERLRASPIK